MSVLEKNIERVPKDLAHQKATEYCQISQLIIMNKNN